ncbi:uncharacterized protein LOC121378888 [Gigantopelta aegis]|uniref:uncharacterized protein LOC121378888 n=1 Tax=Gigantopelta aegis TaxID=1735272 RepID=UPI001B88919C|nr:uncharacterized protein LOC121378888 [Gigantopelta aegis]
MSQPSNQTRWENFLSELKPLVGRRSRGEQIEKDTLVGPASISWKFVTSLSQSFEIDKDTQGLQCNKYSRKVGTYTSANQQEGNTERETSTVYTHSSEVEPSWSSPLKAAEPNSKPGNYSRMVETSTSANQQEGNTEHEASTAYYIHSSQVESNWSSPLKAAEPKSKPMRRPLFQIDDRATSVSKWDLSMLSKYIEFEDVEKLNVNIDEVDQSEEMENIIQGTLNMLQTSSMKPKLGDVLHKEENVRMFLTAILQKVCMERKFGFRTEEQINFKYMPTCKFDYLFRTREGKPIGCMEAKTCSSMNSKAFAQATIQLLVLQQLACKHDVDISTVPVFNILTDGQRFVLMQVMGDKMYLEHVSKNGEEVLKIRTTQVMESLLKIVEMTLSVLPEK